VTEGERATSPASATAGRRGVRVGAVVAIALAAGFIAWFLATRNDDAAPIRASSGASGPALDKGDTVPINAQGLRALAGALKQPIYWAGTKPGYRLELTRVNDGRLYVRYLPRGVKLGTKKALLTIGTYPLDNAYQTTASVASRGDSVKLPLTGGVAFYGRDAPHSVYFAYPGSSVQVEVYDPWAPGARRLVKAGKIVSVTSPSSAPTPTTVTSAPQALTLGGLREFARKVGHPVYWLGARQGSTYEVSQSTDGRVFLRYLPSRAAVGSTAPYLTVGTYPVRNAADVTRTQAHAQGSVSVPLGSGAVAFYAAHRPTNVYEAFPGVDYQVEVYSPVRSKARSLVAAGRVVPIG
jgi:hypothetical protein